MSLTKRLAVMAIFINIILLFICPGVAIVGHYTGLRELLHIPLACAPLAAFVFLIVGCSAKQETTTSRAICRTGLLIVAFSIIGVANFCNFGNNGVYELFPNFRAVDVQTVEIVVGSAAEQNISFVKLDAEDSAKLMALLPQITCQNPLLSDNVVRANAMPEGALSYQFRVVQNDDTKSFSFGSFPPYYIIGDELASLAADGSVCQQLADLYTELSGKYAPMDLDVAALD